MDAVPAIRRGTEADAQRLAAFAARLFEETFGHATPPADMALHLQRSYGVRQQAREIADPNIVTFVADHASSVVAFAQLRPSAPPPCVEPVDSIELWRFYVDGPWQGRGLAQVLMREVLTAASGLGASRVWLSVWEQNHRARRFYERSGFEPVGTHPFVVGEDVQTDCIMVASPQRAE